MQPRHVEVGVDEQHMSAERIGLEVAASDHVNVREGERVAYWQLMSLARERSPISCSWMSGDQRR